MRTFRIILVVIIVGMAITCAPVDKTKPISYADAVALKQDCDFQKELNRKLLEELKQCRKNK